MTEDSEAKGIVGHQAEGVGISECMERTLAAFLLPTRIGQ